MKASHKIINKSLQALDNLKIKLIELDDLLTDKPAPRYAKLSEITNECLFLVEKNEELLASGLSDTCK